MGDSLTKRLRNRIFHGFHYSTRVCNGAKYAFTRIKSTVRKQEQRQRIGEGLPVARMTAECGSRFVYAGLCYVCYCGDSWEGR